MPFFQTFQQIPLRSWQPAVPSTLTAAAPSYNGASTLRCWTPPAPVLPPLAASSALPPAEVLLEEHLESLQ